jgi:hypothetical protein
MPDGPDDHAPPGPDTGVSVTIDSDGHLKGVDVSVGGHGPGHVDLGPGDKPTPHDPGWAPNQHEPVDLHDLRPLWVPPNPDTTDDSATIPSGPYVTDPDSGQGYDPFSHPHEQTLPDTGPGTGAEAGAGAEQPDVYSPDVAPPEAYPEVEAPAPEGWE